MVVTTSSLSHARLGFYKQLYAESARGQAALWVVPANLSSYADLDNVIEWIGSEQTATVNGATKLIKPALKPTLLFPFAAPSVSGTLADAGAPAEMQMRLLLWSVERLIAGLSAIGTSTHVAPACTWSCPAPPTGAGSAGTAPTGNPRRPWTRSLTGGTPKPRGNRTPLWYTCSSAGCGAPVSWAATIPWLKPWRRPGSPPTPPTKSPNC